MTNVITRIATPPAWYPDPADSTQVRYWDGLDWTSHLSPNPAAARPTVALVAPQPQATTSTDVGDFFYQPMISATRPTFQPVATAPRVSTSTLAGWAYALVPLLAVPFLLSGADLDSGNTWSIAGAALLGLMVIALGLFAGLDHSQLRRRGVLNAPSGLVGIIPLAFVIGRAARVGRSGAAIVVASLAVQAAVIALVVWRVLPILT